jgi:hypothetical protein
MFCTFENCNTELHKKTKSGFCPRHRRVMYTRKWSNEHKEYSSNRYQVEKSKIRERLDSIPKEKVAAKNKKWYQNNKDKAKNNSATWAKSNSHKRSAAFAKYRATKMKATPKWVDLKSIETFYKNRPVGYHVDHIVPLQGKNVSGLHVVWNLQYLTISENCSKGNKHG